MVAMWAVAFVLVVLVVVAVAVALVRRPRGDDIHSVQDYNHALGTLEHLSERIGPPTVRPIARQVTPGGSTGRTVPPVPVRGSDEFPDPDAPIVFDDARPVDRFRPGAEGLPSAHSDRAQRMALDSMNHRRRSGTGITVVVVVVLVVGALALIGSSRSHRAARSASSTTTTGGGSAATTSTTRPKPTPTTRPTPTTLPTQFVATTSSSAGTSATYTVPNAGYQLTLTGTGSCWVQVDSSSGSTLWAGALSAGTVQNVQVTGTATVQFGTPALTLAVDTVPVVLPSPLHTPFVATFTPSAGAVAAAAAAGPTTTTTPAGTATTTTVSGGSSATTASP